VSIESGILCGGFGLLTSDGLDKEIWFFIIKKRFLLAYKEQEWQSTNNATKRITQ
jgi:hypothetical protein